MSDKYHNVIGIDLGTTYSAVATFNKLSENTEIVKTESGEGTIPSVVSYDRTKKKAYAGIKAKNNYPVDPENTVIEIKREMGEVVNERNINEFKKLGLDPKINEDPYRIKFADEMYMPQEISAFILLEVKKVAEDELGETINDAVITVPAYFTEKQKKATEEAALLAGLFPRQLIPEPTAAAICYGVDEGESEKMTYLVYDLGGGTFDVSIIGVEEENIAVIATSGDSRLGGSDFDDALTSWVLEELKSKHQIEDVDNKNIAKIKAEAEKAKMILSDYNDASIDLSFIGSPDISSIKITRDKFEELVDPLLRKSLNKVDEAIQIAHVDKSVPKEKIDNILLVGGSTKIPKVKTMLLDYFGKSDDFVSSEADPDTVVARGAAIMAKKFEATPGDFDVKRRSEATLMSDDTDGIPETVGLITEHSLSIGVAKELVSVIIERGRNLAATETKGGFVNSGPSTHIPVPIFQGESKYAFENTLIGTLNIGPLEPKPAGEHKFEVTFNISENGLLDMTIFHLNEKKPYTSSFEQKTGVGGDDKLKIRGLKIIDMFWHASSKETDQATATDSEDKSGAIPPPSSEGTIPPPATHETQPSMPDQEGEYVDFEEVKETQEESRKDAPEEDIVEKKTGNKADIKRPVPAQFNEMFNSAKEILELIPDEDFLNKYNHFVEKVNQEDSEDEIADAGDDLADAVDYINDLYENGLLKANNQIPGQFEQLVSSCKTKWDKTRDRTLQNAYNLFLQEINAGKSEEELADLGDELMDLLESIQEPASHEDGGLAQAKSEVPDTYKMLVRRSKKQILKNADPELEKAYNDFINELNDGGGDSELAELGDVLKRAFQQAKNT